MSRAVMQQALEALVAAYQGKDKTGQVTDAITALRAALAEPEQEPVAWMVYTLDGKSVCVTDNPNDFGPKHRALPLYTAPTPRRPLTDEEIVRLMVGEDRVQLLYAKPDDPYFSEFAQGAIRELVESGRAIEKAHGIGEQHE